LLQRKPMSISISRSRVLGGDRAPGIDGAAAIIGRRAADPNTI